MANVERVFTDKYNVPLQVGDLVQMITYQSGGACYGPYKFREEIKKGEIFEIQNLVYLDELAAQYPSDRNAYAFIGYDPAREDNHDHLVISTAFVKRLKRMKTRTLIKG